MLFLPQAVSAAPAPLPVAEKIDLHGIPVRPAVLPESLVLRESIGLLTVRALDGQVVHRAEQQRHLFETRATVTPKGDYLLMFPEGQHYAQSKAGKSNTMLAYRSSDKGRTWQGPQIAFDIDYNQHAFIPLIPRGSSRIYAFGTQPIPGKYDPRNGGVENAPIGFRWSDDDGRTWSDVRLIQPKNDPGFLGMSAMRMTETESGAWLLGAHAADWAVKPLQTRQYLLRSEDRGETWTVLPAARPEGWFAEGFGRMDEGRPLALGGNRLLFMARTPEGHLWTARSEDDGLTWTKPTASSLVHPDAPPMLFRHSDGKTLIAFHHNRHSRGVYQGLSEKMPGMKDRSEIWVATSTDEGRTWSEPRFLFANAAAPDLKNDWYNYQCSYLDAFVDGGKWHLFVPHRWQQVLHLTIEESALATLPTLSQLKAALER